ncbi:hypothetical protein O9993_05100 [Vibrio lentus]|nr:hypothetical protein [Vibrio lentus]
MIAATARDANKNMMYTTVAIAVLVSQSLPLKSRCNHGDYRANSSIDHLHIHSWQANLSAFKWCNAQVHLVFVVSMTLRAKKLIPTVGDSPSSTVTISTLKLAANLKRH